LPWVMLQTWLRSPLLLVVAGKKPLGGAAERLCRVRMS
jgi:hypothetical protein